VTSLFDLSRFTPHGFCLSWDPWLVWLMAGSDLLIAAAYFSIPVALLMFVLQRRDLAFKPVFALFAAFILACGTTHVFGALTLWVPAYRLQGAVNAMTALLSVATAVMLWPLLPKALALPSPSSLRRVNDALAHEVQRRDLAARLLRESEARQKRLYARTPAALHAVDAEGNLLEVSDCWLVLTGYTREEVIGRNIASFYSSESQAAMQRKFADIKAGSDSTFCERQLRRRDGAIRDVEVHYEPERDEAGKLLRIMAAVTDVTARKQAEAALRVTEEHLRHAQKMEAVGQLTGGIAHDFNNLLTTIMGSLELLQQRAALDERSLRLTSNALEGSRRAARLTSQLLTFSRRQRLAPEPLVPEQIVDGIRDLLARTLGDGITLEVVLPEESWTFLADRNQMEAALLNLVINARDAIPGPGGHVRIDVSNRAVGVEEAASEPDPLPPGDYVVISVSDDGIGMNPEVQARAFEPFFTTKGPGAGTGLGLSQTYGFVTQSGGAIRVESAPGRGTRIDILLPRAAEAGMQPVVAEPVLHMMEGAGEHILLVEDDDLVRHTMAEALRGRGYRVTSACNGIEALGLFDTVPEPDFALMFTDIVMPGGINGVDLANRARKRRPALPVLFATGYSSASTLAAWPEPVDLLPKPYSPEQAAARIAAKLDVREAAL
jgi:PAS domain S-box-containing protein